MNAIETINLYKYYGKARGIVDVSLSVDEGDFFGFIGPNGVGKSTLIRTLLGLIKPSDGSAKVLGLDIENDNTEILKNVGYLPSEAIFYSNMTVRELVAYSSRLRKLDCREEAEQIMERLELDPTKKIRQLSLGNRKKVGIVCALQHKPKLYILDEPTSGLDPLIQIKFFELLHERNKEGATVFLSSHILSEIGHHCKHAGVIKEGKLLFCDSIDKFAHTGSKQVVLKGVRSMDGLNNAANLKVDGDTVSFVYSDGTKSLMEMLSKLGFDDLNINDPDIEELFMNYYRKEKN